jgi:hypothetical protein
MMQPHECHGGVALDEGRRAAGAADARRARRQVFGAKEWDALVQRSILPKLAWALRDALAIDPRSQDLAAWRWVAAWAPVLAPAQLAGLLEQHFFPKWHAVLRHWLAHAPDFDEVTAWFLGWKARARAGRGRRRAGAPAMLACASRRPASGPLGALGRGARGRAERAVYLGIWALGCASDRGP